MQGDILSMEYLGETSKNHYRFRVENKGRPEITTDEEKEKEAKQKEVAGVKHTSSRAFEGLIAPPAGGSTTMTLHLDHNVERYFLYLKKGMARDLLAVLGLNFPLKKSIR